MWETQAPSYGVSHGDERQSVGNAVKGIVTALYGERWRTHNGEDSINVQKTIQNYYMVHLNVV